MRPRSWNWSRTSAATPTRCRRRPYSWSATTTSPTSSASPSASAVRSPAPGSSTSQKPPTCPAWSARTSSTGSCSVSWNPPSDTARLTTPIIYACCVATAKQTKPSDLDLDDAPAKACDVFLVDGNGLAYRAFHALPEELQTAEGQPTNALLGMANMLMRMLADYRPACVVVAWDERPTKRLELDPEYKAHRKPTPPLLQAQRPFFSPLVEAFSYRNIRVEGTEADDVIGTLSAIAEREGHRVCVVSTDRDAFQLASDNVCIMMTPAVSPTWSSTHPSGFASATASTPPGSPTSSASRATAPTTSRAFPASGRRPPPTCWCSSAASRASTPASTTWPARSAASRCATTSTTHSRASSSRPSTGRSTSTSTSPRWWPTRPTAPASRTCSESSSSVRC